MANGKLRELYGTATPHSIREPNAYLRRLFRALALDQLSRINQQQPVFATPRAERENFRVSVGRVGARTVAEMPCTGFSRDLLSGHPPADDNLSEVAQPGGI